MHQFKQLWSSLRSSFWFVPTLMVAAGVALAVSLVEAESAVSDQWLAQSPRLFGATPEGARQVLATIASSMISVLGVTFSMTLVALTLASSQYTSRILRNFMRSRVTQITLGVFAGIFTYCLIVQHTIRSGAGERIFVPSIALLFALALAVSGIAVLVYFIHHIASSIQASSIIASVADETFAVIDRLYPANQEEEPDEDVDEVLQRLETKTWHAVPAKKDGYVQNVDNGALMRLAHDKDFVVQVERGIGEFVVQNTTLAFLAVKDPPDDATVAALNATYSVSSYRTVDQDPAFGVRQIVDMALKALSPGVNDTSTAVICVDYLTAILARLATRNFPASRRYDKDTLRVIAVGPTFEALVREAFDQIRRNTEGNVSMMLRMLGALESIGTQTDKPRRRMVLLEQVQQIAELADRTVDSGHDQAHIDERLMRVRKALEVGSVSRALGGVGDGSHAGDARHASQ